MEIAEKEEPNQSLSVLTGLTEEQLLLLQENIFMLLEDLTYRFTLGKSSSIKTEDAQGIVKSILMAVDAAGAKEIITRRDFRSAYEAGLKQIDLMVQNARQRYEQAKETAVKTELKPYREMIDQGIEKFFLHYDKTFGAAEIPAEIDYFLIANDNRLEGIYYMNDYLSCLLIENKVCSVFAGEDIERLIAAFGTAEGQIYTALHPNIFELVLVNSIFAVALHEDAVAICLGERHKEALVRRFEAMEAAQCKALVEEGARQVMAAFAFDQDEEIQRYICQYVQKGLLPRVVAACENGSITNIPIFPTEKEPVQIQMDYGKKMPDRAFRMLIRQLQGRSNPKEKMLLMRKSIRSLVDYIDLFKAEVFEREEYPGIFAALEDEELAVLVQYILRGERELTDWKTLIRAVKPEALWEQALVEYLKASNRVEFIDSGI